MDRPDPRDFPVTCPLCSRPLHGLMRNAAHHVETKFREVRDCEKCRRLIAGYVARGRK